MRRHLSASYPPPGTRVRWTSRGVTREGTVQALTRKELAHRSLLSFNPRESFDDWFDRMQQAFLVVHVDWTSNRGLKGAEPPYYYRPRPEWLEVAEPAGEEA